ncbi:MAG TPA: histidinol dehydrogenase [Syntrophorhabdaceae bacterium]|nr:histidinol dehydrogenase [Syntrophorhabdaceae bacterium]
MRVWDLEKEYDRFISFILQGREKKKQNVGAAVEIIKQEVLQKKEKALVAFSRKWDQWDRNYPLKLSPEEIRRAASGISREDVAVLKGMIKHVTSYHKGQKPGSRTYKRKGLSVHEEFVPVEKAMVYVPAGTAAYPSSLIMGVVPAKLAGVKEIYIATPAQNGKVNPYICAAASLLNARHVYRVGGAQAIYAFAYGVGPIPKVDMIVGPGNAYVEEAKKDVYGSVGIDMLAGPTELMILCTEPFSPEALSWDMFSQAEHDEMALTGLFSASKDHLKEVERSIKRLISANRRRQVVELALNKNGFLAYYRNIDKAIEAINRLAPEHMELIGDRTKVKRVRYPGVIYVGPHTTVAMGDYYIGTNHVLPTSGAGRFSGGLSVDRFTKRKVVVTIEKSFVETYGEAAIRLSHIEGLFAHGEAIRTRKELLR